MFCIHAANCLGSQDLWMGTLPSQNKEIKMVMRMTRTSAKISTESCVGTRPCNPELIRLFLHTNMHTNSKGSCASGHSGIGSVTPMWHGEMHLLLVSPRELGLLVQENQHRAAPLPTPTFVSFRNGVLEAEGVARLRGGCGDVSHHCPTIGAVRTCSGSVCD